MGRIKSPELADKILSEGKADVISMGRALLADPMLPLKARKEGNLKSAPVSAAVSAVSMLFLPRSLAPVLLTQMWAGNINSKRVKRAERKRWKKNQLHN